MKIWGSDNGWDLDVPFEYSDAARLFLCSESTLQTVRSMVKSSLEAGDSRDSAATELFIKSYLNDLTPWSVEMVAAFDEWCLKAHHHFLVMLETMKISPAATEQVIRQRYDHNRKSLGSALTIAQGLGSDVVDRLFLCAALNSEAQQRQYLFEVATQFHRLVAPRSLTLKPSDPVLQRIFDSSLGDEVPTVRERALVYAYGLGWVTRLRNDIIRLTRDVEQDVRQYALVALGIDDDEESLAILMMALHGDSKPETRSAIWALARRPVGIARLLQMLTDNRDWVLDDILGAVKWVSLPLTDHQISTVREQVAHTVEPRLLESVIGHHLWRTRDPNGKEVPPERGISYAFSSTTP
jgi:hypothetical protein